MYKGMILYTIHDIVHTYSTWWCTVDVIILCECISLVKIPVESDDSDNDQKNGHSSDDDGRSSDTEAAAIDNGHDDAKQQQNNPHSLSGRGSNGVSERKEVIEDSEQDDEEDDDDGEEFEMDQSECSASDITDSVEQDDTARPSTPWWLARIHARLVRVF